MKVENHLLEKKLQELIIHPAAHPDMFVWYFQKLMGDDEEEYSFSK